MPLGFRRVSAPRTFTSSGSQKRSPVPLRKAFSGPKSNCKAAAAQRQPPETSRSDDMAKGVERKGNVKEI